MFRVAWLSALAIVLALVSSVRTEEKAGKALAELQDAVDKAIAKADPSIACILVSRSSGYKRIEPAPTADVTPGQLGRFDETALRKLPELDRERLVKNLDLSKPDHIPESFGSGVVIDESGLVLTNAHVVRNATKIYVRLPGKKGSWADIHASDPRSDLAVLRLQDKIPGLKAVNLGDGGQARKGQFVLLMANPYAAGFRDGSPSVSWGLISNVRRRIPDPSFDPNDRRHHTLYNYPTLFQLETRLNLGCSGGGVFNLDGELIGLTTARAALEGSEVPGGFALPLDPGVRRVIDVLRRGEEVEYGFLGVQLDSDLGPGNGVRLKNVSDGTPASRAGIRDRQYLVSIDGMPVRENDDVFLLIGTALAGREIKVEVASTRNGPRTTIPVTLAKFYVEGPTIASKQPAPRRGLRVEWTSTLNGRPSVPPWFRGTPDGVLVREVVPKSPADRARLQVDKVITKVGDKAVMNPNEFYAAMDAAKGRVTLTLMDERGRPETLELDEK